MDNPPCVFLSPPWTPDCAPQARRGARGTCSLAAKLPPLGNRPHGSQVWQGDALHPTPRQRARGGSRESKLAVKLPPLGDGPRGSQVWQGDALHPTPRQRARGCSGEKQAGRKITAARQQASRLAILIGFPVSIAHRSPWHLPCHGSRLSSGKRRNP